MRFYELRTMPLIGLLLSLPAFSLAEGQIENLHLLNYSMDQIASGAAAPDIASWNLQSTTDWVLIGKSGWLYYIEQRALEYYIGDDPFAPEELAIWKRILEERRDWLSLQGIDYYLVIAPNKETIYPEYMPDHIIKSGNPSRLDQLIAYLQQHSTFHIIDVRQALIDTKPTQRVYHLTDSHWNEPGSLIAYQGILNALAPRYPTLQPRQFSDFTLRTVITPGLELAAFLGQVDQYQEEYLQLIPNTARQAILEGSPSIGLSLNPDDGFADYIHLAQPLFASVCPSGEIPRGVMFRDSFAQPVMSFLAEHFQRMVYKVGSMRFDAELIKTEQPDVVIQEMVERMLMFPAIENPEEVPLALVSGVPAKQWRSEK